MKRRALREGIVLLMLICWTASVSAVRCNDYTAGQQNLYWGDLHVHSAYSLDAYAFGTRADPGDAYAFARGQELTMPDKSTRIKLKRPLDFAAVTDHAETFDLMYLCTDPNYSSKSYCEIFRDKSGTNQTDSLSIFKSYLLPLITVEKPERSPLCEELGIDCQAAAQSQWRRVQHYANEANSQCEFTAFIGNEWSATPNNQHWHRNLIYSGTSVSKDAIDYIRFPTPEKMWQELDKQCLPEQDCDVIAIPHNTNYSGGGGFDVESSKDYDLQLRAKYERLIEIHQSKGNSECLAENWDDRNSDCGFESSLIRSDKKRAISDPGSIAQLKRSFARNILSRGLVAYQKSREARINPLQMGFIGSTDVHVATPGAVDEQNWKGDAWAGGDKFKERYFKRMDYNPGGLVAVWSEENTRESIFRSLKNRSVYGTSGTRIKLRFLADNTSNKDLCSVEGQSGQVTPMGGGINKSGKHAPRFAVITAQDYVPLSAIEIIKGTLKDGKIEETVHTLIQDTKGFSHSCKTWSDPDYDSTQPAYWYTRVLELPTPRWSKYICEELSNCDIHPDANVMIQERAWSSPIWYLP